MAVGVSAVRSTRTISVLFLGSGSTVCTSDVLRRLHVNTPCPPGWIIRRCGMRGVSRVRVFGYVSEALPQHSSVLQHCGMYEVSLTVCA